MSWEVFWLPTAEGILAHLWAMAPNRSEIATSANEIDVILKVDPEDAGESRPGGRRILFRLPLGVYFRVNTEARNVEVTHVWKVEKPAGS